MKVDGASVNLPPGWTVSTKPGDWLQSFSSPSGIRGTLSSQASPPGQPTEAELARLAAAELTSQRHVHEHPERQPDVVIDGQPWIHIVGRREIFVRHDYLTLHDGDAVYFTLEYNTLLAKPAKEAGLEASMIASLDLA